VTLCYDFPLKSRLSNARFETEQNIRKLQMIGHCPLKVWYSRSTWVWKPGALNERTDFAGPFFKRPSTNPFEKRRPTNSASHCLFCQNLLDWCGGRQWLKSASDHMQNGRRRPKLEIYFYLFQN